MKLSCRLAVRFDYFHAFLRKSYYNIDKKSVRREIMEIVNTAAMRKMDTEAIHEYGMPGILLMEHAAMAVMDYIREHVARDSCIMILCGPGNNGGDGFALARLLVEEEYTQVRIHCSVPYDRMSHDEAVYARIAESYGIEIMNTQDMELIKPALDAADVAVDALFGTGLSVSYTHLIPVASAASTVIVKKLLNRKTAGRDCAYRLLWYNSYDCRGWCAYEIEKNYVDVYKRQAVVRVIDKRIFKAVKTKVKNTASFRWRIS